MTSVLEKHRLFTMLLLLGAILAGSSVGQVSAGAREQASAWLDPTLLALLIVLMLEAMPGRITFRPQDRKPLALLVTLNFLVIPPLGYGIANLFLHGHELFVAGVAIYFMTPCTDWFLAFTRLARGDARLGMTAIPIQMALQIILYPLYIRLFTPFVVGAETGEIIGTLYHWFVVPLAIAVALRTVAWLAGMIWPWVSIRHATELMPLVLAALVCEIFAIHINVLKAYPGEFLATLAAVFTFFMTTWWVGEFVCHRVGLSYPQHVVISLNTAARNAPLMLALTVGAIPDQPLVYGALIIGMLLEFPHLTALTWMLQRRCANVDAGAATPPIRKHVRRRVGG